MVNNNKFYSQTLKTKYKIKYIKKNQINLRKNILYLLKRIKTKHKKNL